MALTSWHQKKWNRIRESLWFLPVAVSLAGVFLGLLLPGIDRKWRSVLEPLGPDASSAESLVSTGAGALATILGVAFSLTVVTLQLAAMQYTSRILRRFLADPITQWVLGVYLGTISYMALILRTIEAPQSGARGFVPALSVWVALALFITCVVLLAMFIHHLARSVEAGPVIASIGKDTLSTMERLGVSSQSAIHKPHPDEPPSLRIRAAMAGYLQLVDVSAILEAAPRGCTLIRIETRTGQFLLPGTVMVSLWGASTEDEEKTRTAMREAFALGSERTVHQDVLHGVRQLVDIALKALSPAVNDVTTALMVVNELGAIVHRIISAAPHESGQYETLQRDGVTLLRPRLSVETVLLHAFDELPRAAVAHPFVLARILQVLAELAKSTEDELSLALLGSTVERVREYVVDAELTPWEREMLRSGFEKFRRRELDFGSDPTNPI